MDYLSKLGYRMDSPFQYNATNKINASLIDMRRTPKPLVAVSKTGAGMMIPGHQYNTAAPIKRKFQDGGESSTTELPLEALMAIEPLLLGAHLNTLSKKDKEVFMEKYTPLPDNMRRAALIQMVGKYPDVLEDMQEGEMEEGGENYDERYQMGGVPVLQTPLRPMVAPQESLGMQPISVMPLNIDPYSGDNILENYRLRMQENPITKAELDAYRMQKTQELAPTRRGDRQLPLNAQRERQNGGPTDTGKPLQFLGRSYTNNPADWKGRTSDANSLLGRLGIESSSFTPPKIVKGVNKVQATDRTPYMHVEENIYFNPYDRVLNVRNADGTYTPVEQSRESTQYTGVDLSKKKRDPKLPVSNAEATYSRETEFNPTLVGITINNDTIKSNPNGKPLVQRISDHLEQYPGNFAMGGLTKSKAAEMLHDGTVHGKKITDKQRRYFAAVAFAKKSKQNGGEVVPVQEVNDVPQWNYVAPPTEGGWVFSKITSNRPTKENSIDIAKNPQGSRASSATAQKSKNSQPSQVKQSVPVAPVAPVAPSYVNQSNPYNWAPVERNSTMQQLRQPSWLVNSKPAYSNTTRAIANTTGDPFYQQLTRKFVATDYQQHSYIQPYQRLMTEDALRRVYGVQAGIK